MIDIRKFYLIAGSLMSISVLGQIWNLYTLWDNLTMGAKVSGIAGGVLFNLLLVVLFFGMYKMMPSTNQSIIDNPEMDKYLQELSKQVEGGQDESKTKRIRQRL